MYYAVYSSHSTPGLPVIRPESGSFGLVGAVGAFGERIGYFGAVCGGRSAEHFCIHKVTSMAPRLTWVSP